MPEEQPIALPELLRVEPVAELASREVDHKRRLRHVGLEALLVPVFFLMGEEGEREREFLFFVALELSSLPLTPKRAKRKKKKKKEKTRKTKNLPKIQSETVRE